MALEGMMTEKQVSYLSSLVAKRDPSNADVRQAAVFCKHPGLTSKALAHKAINAMLAMPTTFVQPIEAVENFTLNTPETVHEAAKTVDYKKLLTASDLTVSDGFYDLFPNLPVDQLSFNYMCRYWKVITKPGYHFSTIHALVKSHSNKSGFSWKKAYMSSLKGAILKSVNAEGNDFDSMKLTAKSIAIFGKKTTCCMICGKTLTDPVSVSQGIGPTCAKSYAHLFTTSI